MTLRERIEEFGFELSNMSDSCFLAEFSTAIEEVLSIPSSFRELSFEHLVQWLKLLNIRIVHLDEFNWVNRLCHEFNQILSLLGPSASAELVIESAWSINSLVQSLCPLAEAKIPLAALLMNIAVTRSMRAPLVFRASEKKILQKLSESGEAPSLKLFLGRKLREAVLNLRLEVLLLCEEYNEWSCAYKSNSQSDERLVVEWHDLHRAEKRWASQATNRSY